MFHYGHELFILFLRVEVKLGSLRPSHGPCVLSLAEGNHVGLIRLQNLRDLLTLLLNGDELLLLFADIIKGPTELAHEALHNLRGDILILEHTVLNGLLERIENDLCRIRLGEDTGGNLLTTTLGGRRVRGAVGAEEELGVARGGRAEESVTIGGGLGHGLAEAEWVTGPRVNDDRQVVSSDGTGNGRATLLDSLDGSRSGAVLQDDAELGELGMQLSQFGQEPLLGRQDRHVTLGGSLTVEVQDQALTLHLGEDGIEGSVVDHAGARVGRHTGGVALDTGDAALLGLDDGLGGDRLVQVEGHEVVDIGLNGLQALLVVEGMVDGRDRRDQVGLCWAKCYIAAPIHNFFAVVFFRVSLLLP